MKLTKMFNTTEIRMKIANPEHIKCIIHFVRKQRTYENKCIHIVLENASSIEL